MADENDERPFLHDTFLCAEVEVSAPVGTVIATFTAHESTQDLGWPYQKALLIVHICAVQIQKNSSLISTTLQ